MQMPLWKHWSVIRAAVPQIKEDYVIFEITNGLQYLIHAFPLISEISQISDAFCKFSSLVLITFPFINIFSLILLYDFSYLVIF